jgi:outer membrane receptor for ferrienterochelin and colicins
MLLFSLNSISQTADTSASKVFSMDLEELMNTKVSIATKSSQTLSETPSSVSVITSEEIRNMGAREIEDVLQTVPGFEIRKGYNGTSSVEVRGVKESRTSCRLLLLVDGAPNNEIMYGQSLRAGNYLNMDDIERIEIIRGPGSALYGRNAFSAVINIITKSSSNKETVFAKATIGSFNAKSVSLRYGFKRKLFSSSIAVSKIYTDGSNSKCKDDFGIEQSWNVHNNNTTIKLNLGYDKIQFSGTFYNLDNGGTLNKTFSLNKIFNCNLTYTKEFTPKISFRTKLYSHNDKETQDLEQFKPDYGNMTGYVKGVYFKPQFNEFLYGLETEANFKLFPFYDLLVGLQADAHGVGDVKLYANIDTSKMPIPTGTGRDNLKLYQKGWFKNGKKDYFNGAIYFQNIFNVDRILSITFGGRFDYDSQIGGIFNPRAGLVITPLKNGNIKFLYGRAYRAPAPSEQYVTYGYALGAKDLLPEIINTFEIALNYRFEKSSHTLSFFRNTLKNMIYAPSSSSLVATPFKNIGSNTSKGIEYESKVYFNKNISTFINCSYTISENSDSVNGTTYKQQNIAPFKANFGTNFTFKKYFGLNLNAFYRSKMQKYIAQDFLSGQFAEVKNNIGDYVVFNSSFQINNLIKHLSANISVFNIFDKKYYSQDTQRFYQPAQPGRQILFNIIYSF